MATEITYVPIPAVEAVRNEPKLAKIGQDKLTNVRNKYKNELVKLAPVSIPKVQETKEEPAKPVVQEISATPIETAEVKTNNFDEVLKNFSMSIFKTSPVLVKVVSARKIRVNPKINEQERALRDTFGKDVLFNETVVKEAPIVEETTPTIEKFDVPTVEVTKPVESSITEEKTAEVASRLQNTVVSPSVDDYLQKEVPNVDNGIITELSTDISKLKEEALRRKELLDQLEAQYTDLKNQKAKRIKELEEEKLSYTSTLEGLTDKIKNLQSAISKERQSLGDSEEVGHSL